MDSIQSKNRLLLVDGDPKSLRVLDVSLKKAGFEVVTATSGREALVLLEADHPDLIISDTDLDEMDGFELCSHIKARPEWSKIPFLFVSGRKSIEDKIRGLELGVDDYLTKPIYIKEIGIRVRTALQRAERERMESRRDTRTRFAGDLSDVGVVDLVQTIELNRKSGIIHIVNRDTRHGSIFFRDGKVIDAEVGRLSGANAIYRLFSWSEGQFAVEFKQIRRHDVIDTPMAPLLMEGMRRLDESTRLLDKLPSPSSVLEVDCHVLAEELAELPDEANSVLRLCDGARTLQEVVEDSDHPDLEALTIINELLLGEIIFARETQDRGGESEPGERLAHWLAEGDAEDGAEETGASSEFVASMELPKDTHAVSERTPVPDGSSAAEANDAKPAQVKGVVSVGEGKNSAWLAASPSVEQAPASPRPEPDPTKAASQAATPAAPAEAQDHVLSAEESLGAALSPQADATTEGSNEFARPADTLKGVPVDNIFADQETKTDLALPEAARSEAATAGTPTETRSTKPLGLAERLLSEDSTVRASAMHEAIDDGGGKVEHPQPSDRNTREYGNPTTTTALVNEVVSTSHRSKRESPLALQPERPKKEVDWGKWSTSPATEVPPADGPAMLVGFDEKAQASRSVGTEPVSPSPGNVVPDEVSPHDVGHAPLLADGDVHSEPDEAEVSPSQHPARSANDGGARAVVDSEASQDGATELASTPLSARPPPLRTAPTERRSGQARRFLALVAGAFVLGMVGFLALGRKASQPEDTPQAAVHGATNSPSPAKAAAPPGPVEVAPAHQPVKPSIKAKAVRAVAAASVGKSNKVPVRPGTGPLSVADLRRKCLETDADGKGRAKSVSAACRPALDADPNDVDVMVILARAEIDRGRLVEARSLAKRALAANPQRFDAYVFLGTAEQEAGRIEEARAAYEKYLELAPEGPFAHELRAVLNNL